MRSSNLTWVAGGAVIIVGVAVAGMHYSGGSSNSSAAAASSSAEDLSALALPPPAASLAPPAPDSLGSNAATTLAGEIAAIRPLISDTNGPLDRGTASLALWASANLTWSDIKNLSATTPALFRKDPDQERGRLLCIDGSIQEIRAEKNLSRRLVSDRAAPLVEPNLGGSSSPLAGSPSGAGTDMMNRADGGDAAHQLLGAGDDSEWAVPGGKVFFATIIEPDHTKTEEARLKAKPLTVEAIAVKSSGSLVDGDNVRFCGILTGVVLSGNEQRLEHRAVGMFDLPENTGAARPAASAPSAGPAPAASAAP